MSTRDFNIISFLKQAIQITSILGEIHQEKIIHKDIFPKNIIVENQSGQLKIIYLGLATSLNLKSTYLGNPN